MSQLLFNAPLWILVLLILAGAALLYAALRRGDSTLRNVAIGLLAVAVLLLGLKYLMPTDQKRVEADTRQLADAVGKSDWPTVNRMLRSATMFDWHGQQLADQVKAYADEYKLTDLQVNSLSSQQTGSLITVMLSITTHHQTSIADTVPSTWDMDWEKRAEGWILTQIHPLRIATWNLQETESFLQRR